eukprot:5098098-Pyramimonas_sp.AAC.1
MWLLFPRLQLAALLTAHSGRRPAPGALESPIALSSSRGPAAASLATSALSGPASQRTRRGGPAGAADPGWRGGDS